MKKVKMFVISVIFEIIEMFLRAVKIVEKTIISAGKNIIIVNYIIERSKIDVGEYLTFYNKLLKGTTTLQFINLVSRNMDLCKIKIKILKILRSDTEEINKQHEILKGYSDLFNSLMNMINNLENFNFTEEELIIIENVVNKVPLGYNMDHKAAA